MARAPEYRTGFILVFYILGVVLTTYSGLSTASIPVFVCMVLIFRFRHHKTILLAAALACSAGSIRYTCASVLPTNDISRLAHVSSFVGCISQEPELKNGTLRFTLRCKRAFVNGREIAVAGNVAISLSSEVYKTKRNFEYGDWIRINSPVHSPSPATNPGQFSYTDYLKRQRVFSTCWVDEPRSLTVLNRSSGNPFARVGIAGRKFLYSGIEKSFSEHTEGVVAGMVLGTYAYLPDEVYDAFVNTGTLHILAASGFNCFVLLFLATPLLKCVRTRPSVRSVVLMFLVLLYLLIVGGKPSMERAAAMACLVLLAVPMKRIPNYRNLYFCVALALLLIDPLQLFDAGFQLSFAAVAALIWLLPSMEQAEPSYNFVKKSLSSHRGFVRNLLCQMTRVSLEAAAATIAITLATTPILVYYFNYFSTVSVVANMLMAAVVTVVFGTGILAGLLGFLPAIALPVAMLGSALTAVSLSLIMYFGRQDWSSIVLASPAPIVIFLYYLLLIGTLMLQRLHYAKK